MEFIDIPTEQTTAATDLLLAVVAIWCIFFIRRIGSAESWKTNIWSWIFGFVSVSGVLGALMHGIKFSTPTRVLLWHSLFATGGLAISLIVVGVIYDLWGYERARRFLPVMLVCGIGFFVATHVITDNFMIFILYEGLAFLFALGAYGFFFVRKRSPGVALIIAGILFSIAGAAIQATRAASFHFIWSFDYNGVFHLLQIVGLVCWVSGLGSALARQR